MRDQYLWAGAVTKTRNRVSLITATTALRGLATVEVGFTGLTSERESPTDREAAVYVRRVVDARAKRVTARTGERRERRAAQTAEPR
jgi:hypothetical protein